MSEEINTSSGNDYLNWLKNIKTKIANAQMQAHLKVNELMLQLYWDVGTEILAAQKVQGWGAQIVDNLAQDLKNETENLKGFSVRNLKYMRSFAEAYPDFPIVQVPLAKTENPIVQVPLAQLENEHENEKVQVPLAQITWYHHISLLTKVKKLDERIFYIQKTIENAWSTNVMMLHIKNKPYHTQGKAINNFKNTLPEIQSDLAINIFKDPYKFDFLRLGEKMKEAEIEDQLTEKISEFLLALGAGFAYVGKQYVVVVDDTDYRIDLLFYHTKLHAYVVVELKAGEFKPEYISKLNFYISAVDEQVKTAEDKPTLGLLLCASKSNVKVEYAMRGFEKPLGVAAYEIEAFLKKNLNQQDEK